MENDHAEMEQWQELVLEFDEIQEPVSRNASISSVANDGRGFSKVSRTGGQESTSSLMAFRLPLMTNNVVRRNVNEVKVMAVTVDE